MTKEVQQALSKCFSARFKVSSDKKSEKKVKMDKRTFKKIIERLQEASENSMDLLNMGVDLTSYEEPFMSVIEMLLQKSFNPYQITLINLYVYESGLDDLDGDDDGDEEESTVTITKPDGKQSVYKFNTVDDVWKVIQAVKDVQA